MIAINVSLKKYIPYRRVNQAGKNTGIRSAVADTWMAEQNVKYEKPPLTRRGFFFG